MMLFQYRPSRYILRDVSVSSHRNDIGLWWKHIPQRALNTQQITELAMRGTHLSFDSWPDAENINSSDTVAGQFSFLREGRETDGFNLIYLSQCCVTWQIVSHCLPLQTQFNRYFLQSEWSCNLVALEERCKVVFKLAARKDTATGQYTMGRMITNQVMVILLIFKNNS